MSAYGPNSSASAATGTDADVRFYELAGAGARSALASLAEGWRGAGADVELLQAVDQDDLWLLVARGGGEPAAPAAPPGARVWRFRRPPA